MFHVEHIKTHIETIDYFLTKEEFRLVETQTKGLLKTTPTPLKENLKKYYFTKKYISHNSENKTLFSFAYRCLRKLNLCYKLRFVRGLKKNHKVLDFGSGDGHFLKAITKKGCIAYGVEPINQTTYKNQYHSIFDVKLKCQKFNTITAWHSIEHVLELKRTIKTLYELLEKDGRLIVALPNHKSFDANYYDKYWAGYDVPRHLWHFDKNSVKETFESFGFSLLSSHPLYLDSYYVSFLSEKYRRSRLKTLRALVVGTASNIKANFTKQYSSNIFIFQKT